MADRLTPLDVSFLYLEESTTAMHVGSVMIFEPPDQGFDHDAVVRHIGARIAFVPRYRQRVRWVPGRIANPVWVDDEDFELSNHVRRSALPRPGNDVQLAELVARVQARALDRSRPLWEAYVVEGLSGGRFAVITKTHQALVDGIAAVDLGQVVLDDRPDPASAHADTWRPGPEPSLVELVTSAVVDSIRRPGEVLETARTGLHDVRSTATKVVGAVGGLASAARSAARPARSGPLNVEIGRQRRYAMVATDLEDYRRVRAHQSQGRRGSSRGSAALTVNDIMLTTLTGALRSWLLTRGEPVTPSTVVRALVPVSVQALQAEDAGALGSAVTTHLLDLPVGEPSPVMRLHQVSYGMKSHAEGGRAVGANRLANIAGFAPPTLHSLGARVASGLSRRVFNLLVINVPGPQQPLYAAGAQLTASYPVVPLAKGQALSVGLTSYDGGVYYGLYADHDAMPDLDVVAQCVVDSLAELTDTVP